MFVNGWFSRDVRDELDTKPLSSQAVVVVLLAVGVQPLRDVSLMRLDRVEAVNQPWDAQSWMRESCMRHGDLV